MRRQRPFGRFSYTTARDTSSHYHGDKMLKKTLQALLNPSIPTTVKPAIQPPATRRTERSLIKSVIDAALDMETDLAPGSIVVCDLMGGYVEHTGIYIGENLIIERNGDSTIKQVTPHEFMTSHPIRTGLNLYAAYSNGSIISNTEISARAKASLGDPRKYNLIFNNCHRFTAYCATGVEQPVTTFEKLTEILDSHFPGLHWVSVKSKYFQR